MRPQRRWHFVARRCAAIALKVLQKISGPSAAITATVVQNGSAVAVTAPTHTRVDSASKRPPSIIANDYQLRHGATHACNITHMRRQP